MNTSRMRTGRGRALGCLLVIGLAAGALPAAWAPPAVARPKAAAATIVVNSAADTDDGTCDATNCTLREAINEADSDPDRDLIEFNIPGAGVQTIRPTAPLPAIDEPVVIDGYTQAGARPNTAARGTNAVLRIVLDGSDAGDAELVILGGNSTVRGLVINNFEGAGIFLANLAGNTNNVIEGNFLGTNAAGTAAAGNQGAGVAIFGPSTRNRVGGRHPADRNLISGNGSNGVTANSDENEIVGNLIGTDKTGTKDLGNVLAGLIHSGGADNLVANNVIAVNGIHGIRIFFSVGATGNRFLGNSIFANGQLGIELGNDGPTPNDADDPDPGPNNLQNFPVLASALSTATQTTVKGTLDSLPSGTFRLQFFANPAVDPNEGKVFLGQLTVSTNANGDAAFTFVAKGRLRVAPGLRITATATNLATGDTSEFSAPTPVKGKKKKKR